MTTCWKRLKKPCKGVAPPIHVCKPEGCIGWMTHDLQARSVIPSTVLGRAPPGLGDAPSPESAGKPGTGVHPYSISA